MTNPYTEEWIWKMVGDAYRRAEAMRSVGLYREARNEILTAIVTALISVRIHCSYSELDPAACGYIEDSLKNAIREHSSYRASDDGNLLDIELLPS
ncbi:MAG: hypothetical protein QXJ95_08305 [Ignisphaera sp.]|uniref:Uncharacterized protein n=1 Tax=Ignisphaera aggregans TaxID=334771 RepID=A0A7J3I5F9_9CREN